MSNKKIPVKYYFHSMKGAPQITNQWGDLCKVMDAVLVNGFNEQNVTITFENGMGIATFTEPHDYEEWDVIEISGCDQDEYNGQFHIQPIDSTLRVKFRVNGTPVTPATGTPKLKRAPADWELAFTDEANHKRAYRSKNPQSRKFYVRIDHGPKKNMGFGEYNNNSWMKWAAIGLIENMNSIDDFYGLELPTMNNKNANWQSTEANQFGFAKVYTDSRRGSGTNDAYDSENDQNPRSWAIYADDRTVYMFISPSTFSHSQVQYILTCFGDFEHLDRSDKNNIFLGCIYKYKNHEDGYLTNYSKGGDIYNRGINNTNSRRTLLISHKDESKWASVSFHSIYDYSGQIEGGSNPNPLFLSFYPNNITGVEMLISEIYIRSDYSIVGKLPGARAIVQLFRLAYNRPKALKMANGDKVIIQPVTNYNGNVIAHLAFNVSRPWR